MYGGGGASAYSYFAGPHGRVCYVGSLIISLFWTEGNCHVEFTLIY